MSRPHPASSVLLTILSVLLAIAVNASAACEEINCCPRCSASIYDESFTVGYSVEERPILLRVLGDGPDTVLLLATIHGNEPAGTPLLERLGDYLAANPELVVGRRVVLIPVMNPDGLAAKSRFNVNGVDLNRNFPAANREDTRRSGTALSEPESQCLARVIEWCRPSRSVSIHQPLACIDYDGPASYLAEVMAKGMPLPVKRLGSRPGSLGSFLGVDLGVPIITLELPRNASDKDEDILWREYRDGLLASIAFQPTELAEASADLNASDGTSSGSECATAHSCACNRVTCAEPKPRRRVIHGLLSFPSRLLRRLAPNSPRHR